MSKLHYHQCPRCKTTWKHGEHCSGNDNAHTCPECGYNEWSVSKPDCYTHMDDQLTQTEKDAAEVFEGFR